jgi:hypothetical protein
MFILFTDETNLAADPSAKFFAYGGLVVPIEVLPVLHEEIQKVRNLAGYKANDEFKFHTSSRPDYVSVEAATQAKRSVMEICARNKCIFFVYVVLHAIAKDKSQEQLVRWGADHIIGKFNYFLSQINSFGIVAVDRLPSAAEYSYLTSKFTNGLSLQGEGKVDLDRIKLYSSTCINSSHASSAMDIVLGAFRYCINQPRNIEAAKIMMADVTRLLWHESHGEHIDPKGLIFRPITVKVPSYKEEYNSLLAHINTLIADATGL